MSEDELKKTHILEVMHDELDFTVQVYVKDGKAVVTVDMDDDADFEYEIDGPAGLMGRVFHTISRAIDEGNAIEPAVEVPHLPAVEMGEIIK